VNRERERESETDRQTETERESKYALSEHCVDRSFDIGIHSKLLESHFMTKPDGFSSKYRWKHEA
jgi:hypothetical protein